MSSENRKKRFGSGTIWILVGLLFLLAALLLSIWLIIDENSAKKSSEEALSQLKEQIAVNDSADSGGAEQKSGDGSEATEEETVYPSVAASETPDYIKFPQMAMPTVEIDGLRYIGVLEIPSLGLELPVNTEWSYPYLKKSPCRYYGSAYMDNLVIAAHNYTSHFGLLKNLEAGAEVRFTDVDGNVFVYEVVEVEILAPTAIEEMLDDTWDLTLFTCTYGGRTRVTVRCMRVEE